MVCSSWTQKTQCRPVLELSTVASLVKIRSQLRELTEFLFRETFNFLESQLSMRLGQTANDHHYSHVPLAYIFHLGCFVQPQIYRAAHRGLSHVRDELWPIDIHRESGPPQKRKSKYSVIQQSAYTQWQLWLRTWCNRFLFFRIGRPVKKKIERWGWRGHVIGCDEQRQMQTVWARNNMRFNGVVPRESRTCARRKNREGQCRGKCHLTGRLRSMRHCAQLICIVGLLHLWLRRCPSGRVTVTTPVHGARNLGRNVRLDGSCQYWGRHFLENCINDVQLWGLLLNLGIDQSGKLKVCSKFKFWTFKWN